MRRAAPLLLAAALAGCATSAAFRSGRNAEQRQDYDRAVLQYSKALQEDPDNLTYRKSLERARRRGSEHHAAASQRLAARGLLKEALDEMRLAVDLAPDSPGLRQHLAALEARLATGRAEPEMEELKRNAREGLLPGLAPGPGAQQPLELHFRGASLQEAYIALGRAAGVNFVFDPQLQGRRIDLDLRGVPFEQALTALSRTAQTFHRVVDPQIVSVIPDTPSKRKEHEQQVVRTFYLSNADLKDTVDLLRIVLGARRVAPIEGANALSINDTPEKIAAAERIIARVDKRRAEVLVEVEILEVNRSVLEEYGIEITSGLEAVQGVAGAVFPRNTTLDQNPYARDNILISSLPGVIYRLLRSDNSARLLANTQLRTSEGETAQARFGDQVPVPVTTFSPIATGGIQQQPITSFEYKNVGVNIDITPRVHHDRDVSLEVRLDISQIGPLFQGLPTFSSRELTSVIRLEDGETTVLAGLIRDEQRKVLRGLPGLSRLPFIGRLFSFNSDDTTQTDIVMTLTPRVLDRPHYDLEDLRSFEVGGEASPLLFEVPSAPQQPAPGPGGLTRTPGPIRPPTAEPTPTPTPPPQAP
jgi:general secretion pathway protein D